jgi:hypothetical protein
MPEVRNSALLLELDGSSVMRGLLNMGGRRVTNVAKSVSAQNVVTKGYTDSFIEPVHLNMKDKKITDMK